MSSLSRIVKSVVFTKEDRVVIEEAQLPKPAPHEVLIRTVSSLISAGTELARLQGTHSGMRDPSLGFPKPPFFPFAPGYSNAGVIEEVGGQIKGLKPGDRVFSRTPHASHVLCENQRWLIQKIPDNVSFDQATFTQVCDPALLAARAAQIVLGEHVAVLGVGVVGQLCLQMARFAGAGTLFAIDVKPSRLELAKANGADCTLNPSVVDVIEQVRKVTSCDGVPIVIDASGNAKAFRISLKLVAPFGRVMVVGCAHDSVELPLFPEIFFKGITIRGCVGNRIPTVGIPQFPWTREEMHLTILRLFSQGVLRPETLVTHKVPYREAPNIYRMLMAPKDDVLGVVLDWSSG